MKTYVVGNWKMNFTVNEASIYLHKLAQRTHAYREIETVVAPPFLALQPLSLQLEHRKIKLAAQTANPHDFGAYTGEVSMAQLRGLVDYCIIGHPERRKLFHLSDQAVRQTVAAALRNGITPILCLGETETEKTFGEARDVIRDQLLGGLAEVSAEDLTKVIVTYEPIWALSTTSDAKIASPDEVAETVQFIRRLLKETYGQEAAEGIAILFGGNVRPTNAGAYLTVPGVNGVMVGAASLVADQFLEIIETAKKVRA